MTSISIDIETLALTPDAVILSIGAVAFSTKSNEVFLNKAFYTGAINIIQLDRAICPNTQAWWAKQDPIVRAQSFGGEATLKSCLEDLCAWSEDYVNSKWWANSPSFDIVILEHALRTKGFGIPWKFYNCMDLRTLKYIASRAGVKEHPKPTSDKAHNALEDAINQAQAVIHYHKGLLK